MDVPSLPAAVAIVASGLAAVATYHRRQMLRPELGLWPTAGAPVQWVLAAQAVFFGYVCMTLLAGGDCGWRESGAYVLSAAVSWIMQRNLSRQPPSADALRSMNGHAAIDLPRGPSARSFARQDDRRGPPH